MSNIVLNESSISYCIYTAITWNNEKMNYLKISDRTHSLLKNITSSSASIRNPYNIPVKNLKLEFGFITLKWNFHFLLDYLPAELSVRNIVRKKLQFQICIETEIVSFPKQFITYHNHLIF